MMYLGALKPAIAATVLSTLAGAVPAIAAPPGMAPAPVTASAVPLAGLTTADLLARGLTAFRAGNHIEARTHFRLLAQRDNPAAETLLGTMAANGQGGPKDDAVAAAWFLRAARQGYAPAQLALADAFARGRGVPQNPARAKQLAKAAALQGQPGAAQLAARLGPDRLALLGGGRP
jgi:TPR repeat protein